MNLRDSSVRRFPVGIRIAAILFSVLGAVGHVRAGEFAGGQVCVRGDIALAASINPFSVNVYEREGAEWNFVQSLRHEETFEYEGEQFPVRFGFSLDMDGDTVVVGAPGGGGTASVFVYRLKGERWVLEERIRPPKASESQWWFGGAVSISGDSLLVGNCERYLPDIEETSVYVFNRKGAKWRLQQTLEVAGRDPYSHFGHSLCIDGDVAVVGARDDEGPQGRPREWTGSASIFRRVEGRWILEQKLIDPETFRFGFSVSVAGDRIVVGAPSGGETASVFVYRHGEKGWIREAVLAMPRELTLEGGGFGAYIDFDGKAAAISSVVDDLVAVFSVASGSWGDGFAVFPDPRFPGLRDEFVSVDGRALLVSRPAVQGHGTVKPRPAHVAVYNFDGRKWKPTQTLKLPPQKAEEY